MAVMGKTEKEPKIGYEGERENKNLMYNSSFYFAGYRVPFGF